MGKPWAKPRKAGDDAARLWAIPTPKPEEFEFESASDQVFSFVHRTEVLANPTKAAKAIFNLLDSNELKELLSRDAIAERASKAGQRRLSPDEIDKLVDDYRANPSVASVARIYGIHRHTVAKHLKGRGLDLSRGMSSPEKLVAAHWYLEGKSSAAIGALLGFDNHTVIAGLRGMNVPIRQPVTPRGVKQANAPSD